MALGVGDIVRTVCNFQLEGGVQYQNVYHHIFDGVGGVSDAVVVADIKTWAELAYDELVGFVSLNVVEQLSFVDQVEWVTDEWVTVANIGTFTPAFVPVGVDDSSPYQCSPFVTFKTSRPQSVGRKFLFPSLDPAQSMGIMTGAMVTAIVAYAAIIVNDLVLDVLNTLHPGVPRTGVNDWLTFSSAVVTDLIGTQRRRRPGYGA